MKRRSFIRTTVAAGAALSFLPASACFRAEQKTGLILYTVRGDMQTDPLSTLDKIASLGYNWLEAASYSEGKFYGMKPSKFKMAVEERAMSLISSHNGLNPGNVDQVINDAAEAGLKYLVIPSLPGAWITSLDGIKEAANFMNVAGEKCKAHGMKLGFHNHSIEFKALEGQLPYDLLLNNTDSDLVTFELDLAWITDAGCKPEDYFIKYPGRFELWHVKDLSGEAEDATLGEGRIAFQPIFEYWDMSGMKYFFIEQDNCITHSPLESIEISRNYLLENVL